MKLSRTLFRCLYYPTIHAMTAIQPYRDLPATDGNRRSLQVHKSPTGQLSATTQKGNRYNQRWKNSPTTAQPFPYTQKCDRYSLGGVNYAW